MKLRIILSCCFALSLAACSSAPKNGSASSSGANASPAPIAKAKKHKREHVTASQGLDETVCKSGAEERTIAVVSDGDGCKVNYTKGGTTKTVAEAKADMDYCKGVVGKMTKNLTAAGYSCE